ncbi:MAG: hypothetical protein IPM43_02995 [Actinomycetota bacterium]|nr:MAG: hypothetical protein IPM43_02995 [Actinomycetota bacterium]
MISGGDPSRELDQPSSLLGSGSGIHDDFLFVPQEGIPYLTGSAVQALGQLGGRDTRSGFWVPSAEPAFHAFVGTYVTLEEYLPGFADRLDLEGAADEHRRPSLIRATVAVNRIIGNAERRTELTAGFSSALAPDVRDRFQASMNANTGGLGRLIVAPQPVLLSLRWLIGVPPRAEPLDDKTTPLHATLFVHLAGVKLFSRKSIDDSEPELANRRMMLALMNLGALGSQEDVYASMDRTIRLWREFGLHTVRDLGAPAADLFERFVGVEIEDALAIGFALMAHVTTWEPRKPVQLKRSIDPAVPDDIRDRCYAFLVQELEESLGTLGPPVSEFDLLAVESRPVLGVEGGVIVLDEQMLWRRCTSGLFWNVHDALKQRSECEAESFRTAFGSMVEELVETSLRRLAPIDLAGGSNYYTEGDLKSAYGPRVPRCDAIVDVGGALLFVEVVSGRLSVQARVFADLAKLETDFDRLVIGKCRQIDGAMMCFLEDEEPLTRIARRGHVPVLVPVLVVGGGFPVNPLSYQYIRERLRQEGFFTDACISGLCLLDLEDVDEIEGLHEHGYDVARLLQEWQASELQDVPLNNYLLSIGISGDVRRPARIRESVDATFRDVVRRLGFDPDKPRGDQQR